MLGVLIIALEFLEINNAELNALDLWFERLLNHIFQGQAHVPAGTVIIFLVLTYLEEDRKFGLFRRTKE